MVGSGVIFARSSSRSVVEGPKALVLWVAGAPRGAVGDDRGAGGGVVVLVRLEAASRAVCEGGRMTGGTARASEVDDYFDYDEPEQDCWTCGGQGWEECDDWDCWEPDCDGGEHTCTNCRGTGLAKDCTYA